MVYMCPFSGFLYPFAGYVPVGDWCDSAGPAAPDGHHHGPGRVHLHGTLLGRHSRRCAGSSPRRVLQQLGVQEDSIFFF